MSTSQTHDASTLRANIPDSIPPDVPVVMVNLLRYHKQAQYPADSAWAKDSISGIEAYQTRYVPTFRKLATEAGGFEIVYLGIPQATLVGALGFKDEGVDVDNWDTVGLIKYPSIEVFKRMVESDVYKETALPHRNAGIADWRLWVTTERQI
ncbi:hypothetical protein B0A52_00253 [Exophiala mesophila]|uniref:DUF1330 domain-containing protein n=1 Tax=Exophiala mesophila TaxID=212818 RepID=A0A438NJI1_EXOME|nr:hypothetical protein B0A52_00253 [Exophiala mesophila]